MLAGPVAYFRTALAENILRCPMTLSVAEGGVASTGGSLSCTRTSPDGMRQSGCDSSQKSWKDQVEADHRVVEKVPNNKSMADCDLLPIQTDATSKRIGNASLMNHLRVV